MYVIKIGGGAAIDEAAYARFASDLKPMVEDGQRIVLVHGANAEFSRLSEALGMPPRMITNDKGRVSRYTDRETMDAMLMTYCGKVNKTIVATFQAAGVNAVGLSAMDGRIATGRRKPVLRGTEDGKTKVLRDDHAGSIEAIDATLVVGLLRAGFVPVITPPALSPTEGRPINVDGDKLAIELAAALDASTLLFFSDTPGLMANRDDEASLIRHIDAGNREAALRAVERGVGKVMFADARVDRPVSRALGGEGTVIAVGGA